MPRRRALGLLAAAFSAPAIGRGAEAWETRAEAACDLLQAAVAEGSLAAAAVHLRRGSARLDRAFGAAASPEALFLLGSITKPMTAVAAMILVDRGEWQLDEPVVRHLPEFSEGARSRVTLRQLLNHTSGLPDQLPENDALRARHAPLSEFVAGAARTPLHFEPGTRYQYQSMGTLLAAEAVERISGEALPDFLEREVFEPFGMARSALGTGKFQLEELVRAQTEHAAPESGAGDPTARDWDWNSPYWRRLAAPWGGAHASAGDVARFLEAVARADGHVLSPGSAREMLRNQTPGLGVRRGLGFALGPEGFGRGASASSFGHTGSTGTIAWTDPESDTTCVILTSLPRRVSGDRLLVPACDLVSV